MSATLPVRRSLSALGLFLAMAISSGAAASIADPMEQAAFDAFLPAFRSAMARKDFAAMADLTRLPFMLQGQALNRAAFIRQAPGLFTDRVRGCLAKARPVREDDAMVLWCPPYGFYFRRGADGRYRLEEFSADGEALR